MNHAFQFASDHNPDDSAIAEPSASHTTSTDSTGERSDSLLEQKRRVARDQTIKFLNHLIRSIDIMVYCELSIMYYMDCSMLKFLIRALPHWFYFTPKPDMIPPIPPGQRPYIGVIFGSNLLCMFLHAVFSPIVAGEATRGYLHGGLLIDFVGQISPVSRLTLWALDLLCLALQVLMMGVTLEKQRLSGVVSSAHSESHGGQDHDFEESGLLRSDSTTRQDIEMQNLQVRSTHRLEGDEALESEGQLEERAENGDSDITGNFCTGESLITNLNVLDIVRTQWKTQNVAASASGVQNAANIAGRRFTITFGGGLRNTG